MSEKQEIMDWLEAQLFGGNAGKPEAVCHLCWDIWEDLKETILSGMWGLQDER